MTCAACRRLRERIAEEYSRLKRAIAGPSSADLARARAIADRQRRIAARSSKTGGTAPSRRELGIAKASHTRRDVLRALLAGVAIASGLARTELELMADEREAYVVERDLERAWLKLIRGGGKPDVVWITEQQLVEMERFWA
jgi:hypothetical protein